MLPDTHTDNIKTNKTGLSGAVTNREIIFADGNFRQISGTLCVVDVVQTVSVDVFGGADTLETKEQWEQSQCSLDRAWAALGVSP